MHNKDVDAAFKFVWQLVGVSYVTAVVLAVSLIIGGGADATGLLFFAGSGFVAFTIWTVELTNANRTIRRWTGGLVVFWCLIILISYLKLAPSLTKIQHVRDAQMYIFVFLGLIGFPTSVLLSALLFYFSIWMFGTEYSKYYFSLQRTDVVFVIDTVCLLLAAVIQWRAVAWWRQRRRFRIDGA